MNVEKRLQHPLQGALSHLETFSAWKSRAHVARAITRLFACKPRDILSVDFKSFDVTVPVQVLDFVFRIIERVMTSESGPVIAFAKEAFNRTGIL
jgi:hypothetical protein